MELIEDAPRAEVQNVALVREIKVCQKVCMVPYHTSHLHIHLLPLAMRLGSCP